MVGTHADGSTHRVYRTVYADSEEEARAKLAQLVTEVRAADGATRSDARRVTFDAAVRRFLYEHLRDERRREPSTVDGYWRLHQYWFADALGGRIVRDLTRPMFDARFGVMRRAGLSRSRMNQARSLYAPFFRWAIHQGMTSKNPMAGFELPTSSHISRETVPPEVEEVALLLSTAFEVVPEVAEILVLAATTGMRRGELVGIRASSLRLDDLVLRVTTAVAGTRVKPTKTRVERDVALDPETAALLGRILERRHELALAARVPIVDDPYLFSLAIDSATPMAPDYLTQRVRVLNSHIGIEDKRSETIVAEDAALRLYRGDRRPRPAGRTGPAPRGAMTFAEIGKALGRSERWASLVVAAAERREAAAAAGARQFDGSVRCSRFGSHLERPARRRLQRGDGRPAPRPRPAGVGEHYGKRRLSADRKAAEHLGRVVHLPLAPARIS